MAKQTFSVGQVLTAAQMTSLQQTAMGGGAASAKTASYTLVAADAGTTISMTSTSATTITVNTGLFAAGDTVFIQNLGSGTCTITAGTATVNTAGSLILPQYDAGILYFVSASSAIFYDYIQVGATSPLTTKGDIYVYGTSDTRLPVGTNGHTLVANSATATGLEWQAPAGGGGMTSLASGTLAAAATGVDLQTISQGYIHLQLVISDYTFASDSYLGFRFNGNSGSVYQTATWDFNNSNVSDIYNLDTQTRAYANANNPTDATGTGYVTILDIYNYASTAMHKQYSVKCTDKSANGTYNQSRWSVGRFLDNNNIDDIQVLAWGGGNFAGGNYVLYGVK
jgi:hypothetical protein